MGVLLDFDGFRLRTLMPDADVVRLEEDFPGYIEARSAVWQSRFEAQLKKRYAVPFSVPAPEIFLGWVEACTTVDAYHKRGVNTSDEQFVDVVKRRTDALEEVALAADAVDGLFDLPLRQDTTATGISRGGPLAYSEASPYTAFDQQAIDGHNEDSNGRG